MRFSHFEKGKIMSVFDADIVLISPLSYCKIKKNVGRIVMIYYVSPQGSNTNSGEKSAPFKTINYAAQIAKAGDTVKVFGGEYREWVSPKNSGTEKSRIVYEAVEGEHPIIKGSEIVTDWENLEGAVWKKVISNELFGDYNPYKEKVCGDWFMQPVDYDVHLGEVYINGRAMYEAPSMDDIYSPKKRFSGEGFNENTVKYPDETVYVWLAEVDEEATTIFCNFGEFNPNENRVEINVRKCCFYPTKTGRNYITVRGFEMAHAACPFTPPTSDQIGMLGANWSRGWIIENNHLHDAKCSALSLGKEASTGDNDHYHTLRKAGYTYQKEAVFAALCMGWSKETIGSHLVQNNHIHHCGQNGIVGHLGCVYSTIRHNHIHDISYKQEFFGYELGGIKLHAPIDVVIENNLIHGCAYFGTWLDWQAQGTRVTKNVYYDNGADVIIEVSHGPCTVDNNLFLSDANLGNSAQGTAFVHNIFAGSLNCTTHFDRQTPYHFPHSTMVKGCEPTYGGDDRLLNNIFMGQAPDDSSYWKPFAACYDAYSIPEDYYEKLKPLASQDLGAYIKVPQPVWLEDNVYSGTTTPSKNERGGIVTKDLRGEISEMEGEWQLTLSVSEDAVNKMCKAVTTQRLGTPRLTEAPYDNPDGTPIDFDIDLLGNMRKDGSIAGPFAKLSAGTQKITVWKE